MGSAPGVQPRSPQSRYEPAAVRSLFDEMSATYGIVNLISSFGFSARWRHQAVADLPLPDAAHVVDLMSGMNELCRSLAKNASVRLRVTAIDFSSEMVRKARTNWPFHVQCHLIDVFDWDFAPSTADIVISSFGLKTFDRKQQAELARRVASLLRADGKFSFVEISVPPARILRGLYLFYLARVSPWIGKLFLGNPENYRLLGFYTREFGNCGHFAQCLRRQGLEVREVKYFFGCATGVRGSKPQVEP